MGLRSARPTHLLVANVVDAIAVQAEAVRAVGRRKQVLDTAANVLGELLEEDLPVKTRSVHVGRRRLRPVSSTSAARATSQPKLYAKGRSAQFLLGQRPRHKRLRCEEWTGPKAEDVDVDVGVRVQAQARETPAVFDPHK